MDLNLKSEIDRLNNNKEKIKRVATNIDNKLIEVGGERATDLADVANKIKDLASKFAKIAVVDINKKNDYSGSPFSIDHSVNFSVNGVSFPIKRIIIKITHGPKSGGSGKEYSYLMLVNANNFSGTSLSVQTYRSRVVEVSVSKWDSNNNITLRFKGTAYDSFSVKILRVLCLG